MKITVTITVEAEGQPPESWDIYLRKSIEHINDQKGDDQCH